MSDMNLIQPPSKPNDTLGTIMQQIIYPIAGIFDKKWRNSVNALL